MKLNWTLLIVIFLSLTGCLPVGCIDKYLYRGYSCKPNDGIFELNTPRRRISRDSIRYYRLVVACDSILEINYFHLNWELHMWSIYGVDDPSYNLNGIKSDKRVRLDTWDVFSPMLDGGYNTYNYGTMIETNKGTVNIKSNK